VEPVFRLWEGLGSDPEGSLSLRPTVFRNVPASTATVACPHGHPYLLLRGWLGMTLTNAQFASLFANCGQRAECSWWLAFITLL
jgi:hypothetical protein